MRKILASLSVVILVFAAAAPAQKRNITEKDLFDFTWIGDPQISPDGSTVAFVKVAVNDKKDGYTTSIKRGYIDTTKLGVTGGSSGNDRSLFLLNAGLIGKRGLEKSLS